MNNHFKGRLNGLKIVEINDLKKLLIIDQIKRCTSLEMRENFIDSWTNFKHPL